MAPSMTQPSNLFVIHVLWILARSVSYFGALQYMDQIYASLPTSNPSVVTVCSWLKYLLDWIVVQVLYWKLKHGDILKYKGTRLKYVDFFSLQYTNIKYTTNPGQIVLIMLWKRSRKGSNVLNWSFLFPYSSENPSQRMERNIEITWQCQFQKMQTPTSETKTQAICYS